MFELDLDLLHNVAMKKGLVARRMGKTVFSATCMLQRLELTDQDKIAYWVVLNRRSVPNCVRTIIELATVLNYKVLDATHEQVKLDIGIIKFITDMEQIMGTKPADIFREHDEDLIYRRPAPNLKKK